MKKVMVTGGAGFIGSNLVDALVNKGYEVVVLDDESAECNEEFFYNEEAENLKIDISKDKEGIDKAMKGVNVVFHLAAESRLQPAIINPDRAYNVNFIGTNNVLAAAHKHRINKFVYSSTSSAYGLENEPPLVETMHRDCLNPYSVSKVAAEDLCKMYYKLHGLDTVILRYFNVYGERMPSTGQYAPVIGVFQRQKKEGKPLTVVGDGSQMRDFVYVGDVVNANISASNTNHHHCPGEIINIGSGKNISILEVAKMVDRSKIEFIPRRSGEADTTVANILKARRLLDWKPNQDLGGWIGGQ